MAFLDTPAASLDAYLATDGDVGLGRAASMSPEQVIDEIEVSVLRCR